MAAMDHSKVAKLSSGYSMPLLGFGTARLVAEEATASVRSAIRAGYRHFDCAKVYGNEDFVGDALRQAVADGEVTRRELFVTSKVWNDDHRPEDLAQACRRSLEDLGLVYLDLYLVHWPTAWRKGTVGSPDLCVRLLDTWRAMERLVDEGLVRSIGVSNFGPARLRELLEHARIPPVVNQIELHPFLAQHEMVRFCHENGIRCTAWSPLAAPVLHHNLVAGIAQHHRVSPARVMLRWNVQRGVAVLPRSSNPVHVAENANLWSFTLSSEEMRLLDTLDRGQRKMRDVVGVFEDTPLWPWGALGSVLKAGAFVLWLFLPHVVDLRMPQRQRRELIRMDTSRAEWLRLLLFPGLVLLVVLLWSLSQPSRD